MKKYAVVALVSLVLGLMAGGILYGEIFKCPAPPSTRGFEMKIDSLSMENARIYVERDNAMRAAAMWQTQVDSIKASRPTSVKHYKKYAKAAYDSGLDALRDSLLQGATD